MLATPVTGCTILVIHNTTNTTTAIMSMANTGHTQRRLVTASFHTTHLQLATHFILKRTKLMADSSFGLKIGLEGEREFKRAITEINRQMRVLGSEMKLAASQFAKNETSAASLTAKNQVLAKEIDAQRSNVETLRAALDNAAQSFGENDSRTKNWQIQLNNAQATLNGLED